MNIGSIFGVINDGVSFRHSHMTIAKMKKGEIEDFLFKTNEEFTFCSK